MTLATGQTAYLKTAPVDPYDLLRGRYVTLDYAIARWDVLSQLPGWPQENPTGTDRRPRWIYITLQPQAGQERQPWQAVQVSFEPPQALGENQRVLKGRYSPSGSIDFDLGRYFIPEERGDALEEDMRRHPDATVVEIKLDASGNSAITGLWVEDRRY
jgi:uncharacterized membrane-anchored protein